MSRITNAILNGQAYARGANQPMLDLGYGGQMGYATNPAEWVNNQAYIKNNLIMILLEAPRFFNLMPNPEKWVQTLKALVELHPRTIDGYNAGITVEFEEHPFGAAGEVQHEIIQAKRATSNISYTYVEKYGNPIQNFIGTWIEYGMISPDTQFALASTLSGQKPEDLLADWNTMTTLAIEPDPLHQKVVRAWLTTNQMPKGTGDITAKRDITASKEMVTPTIEWTGISFVGLGINAFAQKILSSINIAGAVPYNRPSFINDVSSDVAAISDIGYGKGAADLGSSALTGPGKN